MAADPIMFKNKLEKTREKISVLLEGFNVKFFFTGLACLFWYLIRTGVKPSRANYPCQKAAATTISIWFAAYFLPFLLLFRRKWKKPLIVLTAFLFVFILVNPIYQHQIRSTFAQTKIEITLNEQMATDPDYTNIFVVRDTDGTDDGVERLVSLMGSKDLKFYESSEEGGDMGPEGIIGSDDVVMIKVNSQWWERGGTNTDLLKSIIEAITSHPDGFTGEVVLVDNGQGWLGSQNNGGSFDWPDGHNNAVNRDQTILDVVSEFTSYNVSIYNWQDITQDYDGNDTPNEHIVDETNDPEFNDGYVVTNIHYPDSSSYVSYPKFTTVYNTHISFKLGIWDNLTKTYSNENLVLINVPVLKSHSNYGVTGCVKNYMGVPSQLTSDAHHSVDDGGMGTLMVNTRMPDLNILDCMWVNAIPGEYTTHDPGVGPSTSYTEASQLDIIVAGVDPVAIDYWASKNILLQTAEIEYPTLKTYLLDPDYSGEGTSLFSNWLNLTNQILNAAERNTIKDNAKINVFIYGAQRTCLEIMEGWNLVGVNWIPSSSSIDTIFINHMEKIHSIYTYDELEQTYKIWINGIDEPDALSVLECGKGYWVKATEAFTIDIPGNGVSEKQFDSGWNLIGLIGDTPETPESYFADESWLQVSCYNPELKEWIDYNGTGGEIYVSPGIGYWVKIE